MKKIKATYNTVITVFFLAVFVHAIGKNIACGIEHLPIFTQKHKHAHSHTGSGHSHKQEHKHAAPEVTHEHKHEHGKKENKEEDCCKKIATVFYASLSKPSTIKGELAKTFESPSVVLNESLISRSVSFKKADYFSWKAPPPKIPDIRIFIKSFLI